MKILILGIYNTGSTSLQYGISEQGYTPIFEPYNPNRIYRKQYEFPMLELMGDDDIVVKCITDQIPNNVSNDSIEFYNNFINSFDVNILLSRRNKEDHFISFLHQQYHRLNNMDSHKKYEINMDLIYNYFTSDFIDKSKEHLFIQYDTIEKISSDMMIPITYYEDLYNSDKDIVLNTLSNFNLRNIDINKLSDYLNINKKYRVTKTTII
jgi:hypothetical protein